MASTHMPVEESDPAVTVEPTSRPPTRTASAIYRLQIALLEQQVATLQTTLEYEREQKQAIIDRYEQILERRPDR